jgi:NADH-quinone oxidoreductase subunit A
LYFDFSTVFLFAVAAAGFVVVSLLVAKLLLRPASTDVGSKLTTYECGEPTVGDAWIRFDIRFYTVALMFVIFDVEVALLFPWGTVFRSLTEAGLGWLVFVEAATFILILVAGLAYVWARGDIDWTPKPGTRPRTTEGIDRPERAGRIRAPRDGAASLEKAPEGAAHDR